MKKIIDLLFFFYIASLLIQITVYQSSTSSNTLLMYHVLLVTLFLLTIPRRPKIHLSPEMIFFASMTATSLLGWAIYGFTIRGVLLPLAFMSFVVGNRWQERTPRKQQIATFQWLFAIVFAAVVMRNLIYYESLGLIYSRLRSETPVFFLASGGRNIEATQLGMLATLLIGNVMFFPAVLLATITSVLMLSRAGLLAVLCALLMWLIQGKFGKAKLFVGSLAIAGGMTLVLISLTDISEVPILDRFDLSAEQSLADDDQGRLAIWRAAGRTLAKEPFGHGTGNGFPALNEQLGGHLRENNSHNILVDFAIDGGLHSALLFVFVMISILRTPGMIHDPSHRFAVCYGLLGLFEFTGYDAIGWFYIGVCHATRFNFNHE